MGQEDGIHLFDDIKVVSMSWLIVNSAAMNTEAWL